MLSLAFRIRRPKGIGAITAGRDGVVLQTWCNLQTDFVLVRSGRPEQAQEALHAIVERFGPNIVRASTEEAGQTAALVPCPAKAATSVMATLERHAGILQPPVVSADGWDTFRAVLLDDAQAPRLLGELARLGEFELLAKKPIAHLGSRGFFVPSTELLDGLTRRQAEAVVHAARSGYYGEPRATTLERIAEGAGLSRASLEEHLRKAENKIMRAVAPFVAVHGGSLKPARPRGKPFAGKRRGKEEPPAKPGAPRARDPGRAGAG